MLWKFFLKNKTKNWGGRKVNNTWYSTWLNVFRLLAAESLRPCSLESVWSWATSMLWERVESGSSISSSEFPAVRAGSVCQVVKCMSGVVVTWGCSLWDCCAPGQGVLLRPKRLWMSHSVSGELVKLIHKSNALPVLNQERVGWEWGRLNVSSNEDDWYYSVDGEKCRTMHQQPKQSKTLLVQTWGGAGYETEADLCIKLNR